MDLLTNFSEFYTKIEEMQKSMRVSNEMEKIDDENSSAYEAANEYLQSRQDNRSSVTSRSDNYSVQFPGSKGLEILQL